MSMQDGWGLDVWSNFSMDNAPFYKRGDQEAIEAIYPNATYLQDVTPAGYFLGYRDLTDRKPDGCAVVVFAGSHKPDNCPHQWIKDAWV